MAETDVRLTVYQKPTCSTCRKLFTLLDERGVSFDRVDYLTDGLSEATLAAVLRKAGLRPREVVRMKEPGARQLPLDDDAAVLSALASHPELLQRPLVVRGERAVLARPPEKVLELLDQAAA